LTFKIVSDYGSCGLLQYVHSIAFEIVDILDFSAWMYFRTFPDDRWVFKLLVSACFIMCLVDTAGTGDPY
jgi:hypothetical protein